MHFQQFYLGCLAQASYLVGDGGECAIVDPRRDVEDYLCLLYTSPSPRDS